MGARFVFEIWQDGSRVAAVDGPDRERAMLEIAHYAMMYREEGPITIYEKVGRKRFPLSNGEP